MNEREPFRKRRHMKVKPGAARHARPSACSPVVAYHVRQTDEKLWCHGLVGARPEFYATLQRVACRRAARGGGASKGQARMVQTHAWARGEVVGRGEAGVRAEWRSADRCGAAA